MMKEQNGDKKRFSKIRPHYVQLSVCEHGIRHDDGKCRIFSAMITFGLRVLPFCIFRSRKAMPVKVKQLGEILPSAVMAILIIYCFKDVFQDFPADGAWRLAAAVITAASYKWKQNTMLSILLGTVSYMILLHI